jgi:hypothetical protein
MPDLFAAIALVAHDSPRPQPGATAVAPRYGAVFHQGLKDGGLVLLARRQEQRHKLAVPFRTEMDFGTEAALAPAERFGVCSPFFAPAACWWARTMVPSI